MPPKTPPPKKSSQSSGASAGGGPVNNSSPFRLSASSSHVEAAPEVDQNSFRYTFSPGRGPFNGPLLKPNPEGNAIEKDVKRFALREEKSEFSSNNRLLQLREQITPRLNTQQAGVFSDAHSTAVIFQLLGESFELNSKGNEGEVQGAITAKDENSIQITSHVTLNSVTFSLVQAANLIGNERSYEIFFTPCHENNDNPPVNRFLKTDFTSHFTHRFVSNAQRLEANAYEWRRRMDTAIFHNNIDTIETLNLIDLANAYSAALRNPPSRGLTEREEDRSRDTAVSFSTVPLDDESRFTIAGSQKTSPVFTDESPSFDAFATMDFLKQSLMTDLDSCPERFLGTGNSGDTGVLMFESSSITITLRMAQYANKTLQNIQADLFLRRARLTFISACLENSILNRNCSIFEADKNKIGLCETLLNDLEHPLLDLNEQDRSITEKLALEVKQMRDGSLEFNLTILKSAVSNLMSQANRKAGEFKVFCQQAVENSQKEIWRTAKQLLNETNFVAHLRALSAHTRNRALEHFANDCAPHLTGEEDTRKALKRLLKKPIDNAGPLVDKIRKIMLKISSHYSRSRHLHRVDFLAPLSEQEMSDSEGFDPFLMYIIRKILVPRQELITYLNKVEDLNACYVLLEICGAWSADLKEALEGIIKSLNTDLLDNVDFQEKIIEALLQLYLRHKKQLCTNLSRANKENNSAFIKKCIVKLYNNTAEASLESSSLPISPAEYIDEHYYRSFLLPHAIESFDHVINEYLKKVSSVTSRGINSDNYRAALFYRQWYAGIFFSDYLRTYPQQDEQWRPFLCSLISQEAWVASYSIGKHEKAGVLTALVEVGDAVKKPIQAQNTPQNYIARLEKSLQQYQKIQFLGFQGVKMLNESDDEPQAENLQAHQLVLRKRSGFLTAYWLSINRKKLRFKALEGSEHENLPAPGTISYDLTLRKRLSDACKHSTPTGVEVDTILLEKSEEVLRAYWMEGDEFKSGSLTGQKMAEVVQYFEGVNVHLLGEESEHPNHIQIITSNFRCSPLPNKHLCLLGNSWSYFIAVCAWITALINRPLLDDEQIAYIHSKIDTILSLCEKYNYFSLFLFDLIKNTWKMYCDLNALSQAAIQEWGDSDNVESTAIGQLYHWGEALFFKNESNASASASASASAYAEESKDEALTEFSTLSFRKTFWLIFALQFHDGVKNNLGSGRLSLKFSETDIQAFKKNENLNEADKSIKRRVYLSKIFGLILSHPSLPDYQRESVQQCTQDIFQNKEIREAALNNVLNKIDVFKTQKDESAISESIEFFIPGFVFSSPDCQILAEKNFANAVTQRFLAIQDRLTVHAFFEQVVAGLDCVKELTNDSRYHVFIPCLMGRICTAFGLIYRYLTLSKTTRDTKITVPVRINQLWQDCMTLIKHIAGDDRFPALFQFAQAWERIGRRIFSLPLEESHRESIDLVYKLDLYDLVLAYDVCLELHKASFNMTSAINVILQQWHEETGYEITEHEVKALRFILGPVGPHTPRKVPEKLKKLSNFFKHAVKEVRRLGDVLCVRVDDQHLLSSYVSSQILPVTLNARGQLDSGHFSLRRPESLDQITIDLAKIYCARMVDGTIPMDYPVIFIYKPSLKTVMHRSSERNVARCVEVFREGYTIVRRDCFVSDDRNPRFRNESSLTSLAARMLRVDEQRSDAKSEIAKSISHNSLVADNNLIDAFIFPEFFNLVLQLIQSSRRFMERMYANDLSPISSAFLKPHDAPCYDPRALLRGIDKDEDALIGIFILGLVYRTLEDYETKVGRGTTWWWILGLPKFFADESRAQSNVKSLVRKGITQGTILQTRYGFSGVLNDTVDKELLVLHEKLAPLRRIKERRQEDYCTWFKTEYRKVDESLSQHSSTDSLSSGVSSARK